jgi:hypothetical protein
MSNLMKTYELVLYGRMEVLSRVDELQSVANRGIDARMQLHLVLDIIAERAALGQSTWLIPVDLARGFPSTERESTGTALYHEGVGAFTLGAWKALVYGTSVKIGITAHQFTEKVELGTGLFEGAVLSPRGFAAHTGTLIRKLRASGLGVYFGGEWCGAPMLMDDVLLIPRDETEVQSMLSIVLDWCYEFRMTVAMDKTNVLHVNGHLTAESPSFVLWLWRPPPALEPDERRRLSAQRIVLFFVKTGNVKYLGYVLGKSPDHTARQLAMTGTAAERVETSGRSREGLKLSQCVWAWTAYGRHNAEWPSAVWKKISPGRAAALESHQVRALLGLLGDAVPRGMRDGLNSRVRAARSVVLKVFGLWELSERRLLARLTYASANTLAEARPTRAAFSSHARGLVQRPGGVGFDRSAFVEGSPSVAIAEAQETVRLFLKAEQEAVANVHSATPESEDGELSQTDDDTAAGTEGDGDSDTDGGTEHGSPLPDDPLTATRKELASALRRTVGRMVVQNRAAGLAKASSADLLNALKPNGAWLKDVVHEQELDGSHAAFVALLIGAWWAALALRVPGSFSKAVCGACGQNAPSLAVHLICGSSGGVRCTGAMEARAAFSTSVRSLFEEYGQLAKLQATPDGTLERLAMMLGNGGNALPLELSRELPDAFRETFGRWSVINAPARPTAAATATTIEPPHVG